MTTSSNEEWKNWHKTIKVGGVVDQIFEPDNGPDNKGEIQQKEFKLGLQALLGIVKSALENNTRVRAFGSKWSLNDAAYTKDCMIKTWGLNYAKIGVEKDMVTPAYQDKAKKLCFVQTGVMIRYLNQVLMNSQLALKTTGASDGQRLIGAIAAGTHGSAMGVGAMSECVKGIHLVIPDGDSDVKHIFLQRKSDQAVNSAFANFLDNTELILDDNLFNAALIGFGSFGLIHGLLIETEDLFLLRYQTVKFNPHLKYIKDKLQAVLQNPTRKNLRALTSTPLTGNKQVFNWLNGDDDGYPYFFSVTQNPYTADLNPRTFFIQVMEKEIYDPQNPPEKIEKFSDAQKHEKHEVIHRGLASHYKEKNFDSGHLGKPMDIQKTALSIGLQIGLEVFHHGVVIPKNAARIGPKLSFPNIVFHTKSSANPSTTSPCPATSTEIAVPMNRVKEAVDCILNVLQTTLLGAPLGIRYIPKSLATLAVNQYDDFTVTIELPGPQQGTGPLCSLFPNAEVAHNAIFDKFNALNIPHRFHWGQQYPKNTTWVTKSYGAEKVASWKEARKTILTTDKARRIFSNDLTDTIGLTDKNGLA